MSYTAPKIVVTPPGPKAREWIAKDHRLLSPSLSRSSALVGVRAERVFVEDVDGNVFLDFGSGIAVNSLGHRHPEVIAAIRAQLDRLIFLNSLDYYTMPQIEYVEMLFKVTPGDFAKRVFYCNSGSEAIDTAIKMAKWHTRRPYGIGFVNFGLEPDIMAISKAFAHGLPAGAAVARAELMDWEEGAHEGTLNGGPVVMEAAKAVLRVIEKEGLADKAAV
jgi:4-aminobutyrate aminotransferase-like enzyme